MRRPSRRFGTGRIRVDEDLPRSRFVQLPTTLAADESNGGLGVKMVSERPIFVQPLSLLATVCAASSMRALM
jgi:hypothetical protein